VSERSHHLSWNGSEWVDERCGCRYHPDDDNGTHGGAPHVHLCERHGADAPLCGGPLASATHEAASIVCHRIAQFGSMSRQAAHAHSVWSRAWMRWMESPESEGREES